MAYSGKRKLGSDPRPVKNIALSDKDRKKLLILLVIFLAIAVVAITVGLFEGLTTDPGWDVVESTASELNVSGDFVFSYCYGRTEESATAEKKRLSLLYTEASVRAWDIFHVQPLNICENVNETVTVDPALYAALEKVQSHGSRYIFLGPIYTEYRHIFQSEADSVAASYDPAQAEDVVPYLRELAGFVADPAMVDLQLLGNNQVKLVVAPAYLAYAQENEITEFLDLGWMTNAFVADFLAETIKESGFTKGFLSSADGFTRNLFDLEEEFNINLFNRIDNSIYLPGSMQYSRPAAMVFYRDFPMSQRDRSHYYTFQSGRIVSGYVDPADGLNKCATDALLAYSYESGCVDILLEQNPVFIADVLDTQKLDDLAQQGIYSIWFEGTVLHSTDPNVRIKLNPESGVNYTLATIQ